ncbi:MULTISPECIES: helix-turn-helix domain-containing protein [Cytobacillus]|uniref:Immunity repressor protein n=1 Tax=Cytobacillus oceanisediminis 2691 TaxID=1196031 RepID=A0A160M8U4_9BACI|nr:helix-turn-helix transcriptional regulator [Cytobacillus oceanisediminis]AND39022.1 immunity repressor protein [Cytobacillus oceanisediminis 2691]MBU8732360.1 helix-turn-helix transcriptional regulator [Cytobacillus oceanisediminis]MCM3404227.1 helix-turn-helix transcriptional regulator [Cytobacillus oceanisediminis]MDK7666540.1 helix-turn-helix transcriptional regulator [Cytobacillus oceanisediminis]
MSLGIRLKKEREKRKWSQKEVAEKVGITNAVLSNYERDYRDPDTETLKKLADLYEVETDYLLGRSDFQKSNANLQSKDEKDIAKRMEKIRQDLSEDDGYMLMGEPISEEAKESIMDAMEYAIRQATRINKKYIPKKYRDKQD